MSRDITITEVDIGCLACATLKLSSTVDTVFFVGVSCGMHNNAMKFCTPHLELFQRAVAPFEKPAPAGGSEP